jgi:uncharacterized protein YdaU (DUF1376 family)
VNYYKRHIGDYAAATRHLSLLEHGVYGMLLDVYYTTEKPLPADERAVFRLIGARSDDEREAAHNMLAEFFRLEADGWHQGRCDEEIAKKDEKSAKNQITGKMGGRPKEITDSVIEPSQSLSEKSEKVSDISSKRNPSHKPLTTNQYSQEGTDVPLAPGKPEALPPCPHLALLELFGKHLPELPQPKPELWAGRNADNLRARWKWVLTARRSTTKARYATNEAEALDWFARFFAYVAGSDFLSGRSGKWANCDLGWLVKADNFAKVIQGNYENREAA